MDRGEAVRRIAAMDPWYQDPDDGWVCVFCGARPVYPPATFRHDADCPWTALQPDPPREDGPMPPLGCPTGR